MVLVGFYMSVISGLFGGLVMSMIMHLFQYSLALLFSIICSEIKARRFMCIRQLLLLFLFLKCSW